MNKFDIILSWNANIVWGGKIYGNPRMRSFGSMPCLMNLPHEMKFFSKAKVCSKVLLSLM